MKTYKIEMVIRVEDEVKTFDWIPQVVEENLYHNKGEEILDFQIEEAQHGID